MDPDDAQDDRDDDRPSWPPPRRYSFDVDIDSVGGWTFLILFLLLAYRCSGVTLW